MATQNTDVGKLQAKIAMTNHMFEKAVAKLMKARSSWDAANQRWRPMIHKSLVVMGQLQVEHKMTKAGLDKAQVKLNAAKAARDTAGQRLRDAAEALTKAERANIIAEYDLNCLMRQTSWHADLAKARLVNQM